MDKWLTVPPDLEPFIGTALALYSLYRPKKNADVNAFIKFHLCFEIHVRSHYMPADFTVHLFFYMLTNRFSNSENW
jgi:hypothetical protein